MKREGEIRIPSGCAIAGIVHRKKEMIGGSVIANCIAMMHDRSNGLGGGFAGYGIYPEMGDAYAMHVFYEDNESRRNFEEKLHRNYDVIDAAPMPVRKTLKISQAPLIWRYFVHPNEWNRLHVDDMRSFMANFMTAVNAEPNGVYIVSFGRNMGVFKGVGYPEDIAEYYRLDEYQGYQWTSHGRFPTNTPGWWGGAHPFALLDSTIVHNGEISSYDANRRWLEMFGYRCSLQTDTEVITYAFDWLCRRQGLSLDEAVTVVAPPLWNEIAALPAAEAAHVRKLREVYGALLLNGPFSIILGGPNGMMALNDRIKLRPMVSAEDGDFVIVASEESAIRAICPNPQRIWSPRGGEPVWGMLDPEYRQNDVDDFNLFIGGVGGGQKPA
ncbi:MAG: class II glutamine amidotransferase [Solirubrobacterales bacterium]